MKTSPVVLLFLVASTFAFAQTSPRPTVELPTHRPPASYTDIGPASPTLPPGRALLYLSRSVTQQAQLDALIREQSDPSSPNYRRFLSPAQFGQQFGASDAQLQSVIQWLTQNGFTVTRTLKSRLAIEFTATVPQLQAAFQTPIHAFSSTSNPAPLVYANTSNPRIPAELASIVKGVSLSNFSPQPLNRRAGSFLLHPPSDPTAPLHATPLPAETANPLYNVPNLQPCAPTGTCYALVPGDYATIYDTKPLLAQGIDGTGVTIGIAGISNIDLPTVQRFRTLFLPAYSPTNLPNVIIDGTDPGDGNAGTDEAYIDVETASGAAPNATINLYTAANTAYTSGLILALARAVEDNAVSILSVSFGECEADLGSYNAVYRDFFEQAIAQGITVVVSAGDSGSAGCDPPPNTSVSGPYQAQYGLAVNGIASTPYNIAVGGTDFLYPAKATAAQLDQYWAAPSSTSLNNRSDWSSALSYIPEKPWEDSNPALNQINSNSYTGGGGGQSSCSFNGGASPAVCQGGYPKPVWQQGFGNDTARDVPDVSLFAATGSNYSFYGICTFFGGLTGAQSTQCAIPNDGPNSISSPITISGFGGTSVSTPLFAGILALVSQKTQTPRLGLATPALYALAKQTPAAFHDIAVGTNATTCASGSPNCGSNGYLTGYSATTGYDLATGLGSVDANQLVTNWAAASTASTTQPTVTSLSLIPVTGPHETVVTFTVNVTGTSSNPASGAIAILTGTASTATSTHECGAFPCTFTFNGLSGGTYPVVARFLTDGKYASSSSSPVSVTITPEASEVLIINPYRNNQIYPNNGLNGQTDVIRGESLGFVIAPAPANTPANTAFGSLNFPPPSGTITITDAGVPTGPPVTLPTSGSFYFTSSLFAVGPHSLVVQYSGDASYLPSSTTQPLASPLNFTVIKATPTFGQGSPNYTQVAVGYPISFNIFGSGVPAVNVVTLPPPTGTLSITVNGTAISPATLVAPDAGYQSQTTFTIPGNLIIAGTNTVAVSYSGDANYIATTTPFIFTGKVFPTITDLGFVPASASVGMPVTMYLEVSRNNGIFAVSNIPSNVSVTLLDGTTPFATVPLAPDTSRYSADAQYVYSGLSAGTHSITAQYAGDSGDMPSSSTRTIVITPGVPSFTLATTPVAFSSGASTPTSTSTLTVTPINGFTGTVNLTCSASTIPNGTCVIPPTISVTGGSAATVSVSVSIQGQVAQLTTPRSFALRSFPAAACVLLGFGLFSRRRRYGLGRLSAFLAVTILLATLSACGSSGASLSVPAGTYNVSIQANSGILSKTATIPVTIQ